jgi:hypothetical protein
MDVRGIFDSKTPWHFYLSPESRGQYNLQYYMIRHDFHYVSGYHYVLRLQLDTSQSGHIYQVLAVIVCEEEPLLRFYAPIHLHLVKPTETVFSNPLMQLFVVRSPMPFINTDLKKPTFLSDDPGWTIHEYELAINDKSQFWVRFAHTVFLSFYRRFYYNGHRFFKVPKKMPPKSIRFLREKQILAIDTLRNVFTTPTFLSETREVEDYLAGMKSLSPNSVQLFHCPKFNEALILHYRSLVAKDTIFFTANVTLQNYMRPFFGEDFTVYEPKTFLATIKKYKQYQTVIIDSANKFGCSFFARICILLKPKYLLLFGHKYEGGANSFYGGGGNVFLSCMNMGFHTQDLKLMPSADEIALNDMERHLFNNIECTIETMTMPNSLVFDCTGKRRTPDPQISNPRPPDPKTPADNTVADPQPAQFTLPQVPPKPKTENKEEVDMRPPVMINSLVCINELALYGKIIRAQSLQNNYVLSERDPIYFKTSAYQFDLAIQTNADRAPHVKTILNSSIYHITNVEVHLFPSRYAGLPVDTVYCLVNAHSNLADIFVAFKYAKNKFKIVLPDLDAFRLLSQIQLLKPSSAVFF